MRDANSKKKQGLLYAKVFKRKEKQIQAQNGCWSKKEKAKMQNAENL